MFHGIYGCILRGICALLPWIDLEWLYLQSVLYIVNKLFTQQHLFNSIYQQDNEPLIWIALGTRSPRGQHHIGDFLSDVDLHALEILGMMSEPSQLPFMVKMEHFWDTSSTTQPNFCDWLISFDNWIALQDVLMSNTQKLLLDVWC